MSEKLQQLAEDMAEKGLIFDGLSSIKSYAVLNHNARKGIQLSVRPLLNRYDEHHLLAYLKVRVAYDNEAKQEKAGDFAESKLVESYKKANFPFDTRGNQRVRFLLAVPIVVGFYDLGFIEKHFDGTTVADAFLNDIQGRFGSKLVEFDSAREYLGLFFKEEAAQYTKAGTRATQTKGKLLGNIGPVVHWQGEPEDRAPAIEFMQENATQLQPKLAS